ncbi:MAG: DNA cytosine methyltransferase [Pirellulaceae bacterium]
MPRHVTEVSHRRPAIHHIDLVCHFCQLQVRESCWNDLNTAMHRGLRTLISPNGKGHTMRMLQPLELAVAMGFPADYWWPASIRREKIRLIGNAVCPPVMKAAVDALTRDT